MSQYDKKRRVLRPDDPSGGRLSDQGSRDRLRESRQGSRDSRQRKTIGVSNAEKHPSSRERRPQASAAGQPSRRSSQPALRLRPPRRPSVQLGSPYEERSKLAERERAAGRPGSSAHKERTSSRLRSPVPSRSITGRGTERLEKSGRKIPKRSSSLHEQGEENTVEDVKLSKKSREQREVERRQLQRRNEERLRIAKYSGIAAAALVLAGLLFWGGTLIANSRLFQPETVHVQGTRFLTSADVEQVASIDPESSTVTMDTTELEERLASNPWIVRATVTTHLPREVTIEVTERTPAVKVESEGFDWVASSDGRWLGYYDEESSTLIDPTGTLSAVSVANANLIPVAGIIELEPEWGELVEDESLLNALAHLRGLDSQIVSRVLRVSAPSVGSTSLFTIDEVELDVGRADNLEEKSAIILAILEGYAGDVVLINVRSIENPTWRGLSR